MRSLIRNRKGFALMVAMIAMVIVGTLVAGALFVSTQEYRINRNTLNQERALVAAEAGMAQALQDWDPPTWSAQRMATDGDTMSLTYALPNGARADVRITRLNSLTFLLVSDGATNTLDRQLNSRRRTGLLLRDKLPQLPQYGAFNGRNTTQLTGSLAISGNDAIPPGWAACDAGTVNRAAVANDVSTDVTSAGLCTGFTCASGTTAVQQQASLDDTLNLLAGYNDFKVAANKIWDVPAGGLTVSIIQPSYNVADGSCKLSDIKNWGDVDRANANTTCDTYFPVIYFRGTGTTTLANGQGQGVIIADGNLLINGQFEFYGPIIARGNVSTGGVGNKVYGTIIAANIGCTPTPTTPCNKLAGTSSVQFSSCSLINSMRNKFVPILATRSWADLF